MTTKELAAMKKRLLQIANAHSLYHVAESIEECKSAFELYLAGYLLSRESLTTREYDSIFGFTCEKLEKDERVMRISRRSHERTWGKALVTA